MTRAARIAAFFGGLSLLGAAFAAPAEAASRRQCATGLFGAQVTSGHSALVESEATARKQAIADWVRTAAQQQGPAYANWAAAGDKGVACVKQDKSHACTARALPCKGGAAAAKAEPKSAARRTSAAGKPAPSKAASARRQVAQALQASQAAQPASAVSVRGEIEDKRMAEWGQFKSERSRQR